MGAIRKKQNSMNKEREYRYKSTAYALGIGTHVKIERESLSFIASPTVRMIHLVFGETITPLRPKFFILCRTRAFTSPP
jgi:hypothetical protein